MFCRLCDVMGGGSELEEEERGEREGNGREKGTGKLLGLIPFASASES